MGNKVLFAPKTTVILEGAELIDFSRDGLGQPYQIVTDAKSFQVRRNIFPLLTKDTDADRLYKNCILVIKSGNKTIFRLKVKSFQLKADSRTITFLIDYPTY